MFTVVYEDGGKVYQKFPTVEAAVLFSANHLPFWPTITIIDPDAVICCTLYRKGG